MTLIKARIPTLVFVLIFINTSFAQRIDRKLQRALSEATHDFHGQVGFYFHDLKKNRVASVNSDTVFTTASMVKVPILVGIMDKLNRGELTYHQEFIYNDSLLYAGSDILGSFKSGEKIELSKLIMLMLTTSDNTASLWLQKIADSGTRINVLMDSLGFVSTRVNSRTPGREGARSKYGWGQTTPKEMVRIFERIAAGSIFNDSISNRMLRLLGRNYWDEEGISQIPSDVFVASKNGAVDKSRSEVLFVNGRGRRYILCICTQYNKDESWNEQNEAWTLIRKMSRMVWDELK